jgi:GNAT superfamily N-acetyltransferase
MRASLDELALPMPHLLARHPVPEDVAQLAALMLDAYQGTVDADGSETVEVAEDEVTGWFAGRSGTPLLDHSYVAVEGDRLTSAVLVSRHDGAALIAYVMTAADRKGRGLATGLVQRSMLSLARVREPSVELWVTAGNAPAERIYERLGFRDVAP